MRHLVLLIIVTIGFAVNGKAQHFDFLKDVKLTDQESYDEYVDQVFDCCYYVLQTPYDKKDADRNSASEFVVRWIIGCPDCKFSVPEHIKTLSEEREDLIAIYSICHVKEYLENSEEELSNAELQDKAELAFIKYCSDDNNKVKITKEMRDAFDKKTAGEINSFKEYYASK